MTETKARDWVAGRVAWEERLDQLRTDHTIAELMTLLGRD